jgi:hypothetical protein
MSNIQEEVDRNYEAFQKELPILITKYRGQYALMKDQKIINFFSTAEDARAAAVAFIPDHMFSIQQVIDAPIDLGYFNYAVSGHSV